jgi:SpoVK/Ycf46/Vps4 family AAA+-type ATPase
MSEPNVALIQALKQALEHDRKNGPLWQHYAELLAQAGRTPEAIAALRTAVELVEDKRSAIKSLIPLLRQTDQLSEALIRAEMLLELRDEPALRVEYARTLRANGEPEAALRQYAQAVQADPSVADPEFEEQGRRAPRLSPGEVPLGLDSWDPGADTVDETTSDPKAAMAEVAPDRLDAEEAAASLDWGDLYVTFADVAGLKEVKNQINLRIIAPFKNPEIYRAFRRSGGGGILLYGPPGCGKTFIARATAGECGARFMAVGIHEIVDKYWGESEKLMHALFEEARRRAPTVLFFDEFDALGSTRGRTESHFWKTLVDQLLQEMDGMAGRNEDVLIFAATNVPWNVDSAFRRPGRFDRILFVPPPDEPARAQILRAHSEKLPGGERIHADRIAKQTELFTGADLKALCERAAERALSRSLESGKIDPVILDDFERELKGMQSSAQEWLATARNYARYSNEGGQYDDLTQFLKRVKRW